MNEMVKISREEYDRLLAAAEDLSDLRAYDRTKAALEGGEDELIPAEYVNRILAGESPLRVFRDLRGLTQTQLAETSNVNRVQIADIEAGRSNGSIATVKKLAAALGVGIDDLVD
ncbi:MAG: helix-turn-helix transcriptional regulator [Novosphingobium sp.]|nr:helix-turn-helix transcriptional regulator [Novosphingobium sp.]